MKELLQSKEGQEIIHQQYSATCFNKAWTYLDKKKLSDEDVEDLIATSQASLWHWKQRSDCQPQNLSIAYWQLGRVYCVTKMPEQAQIYADKCLKVSQESKLDAFYIGYAYETLLNTAIIKEDKTEATKLLELAKEQLKLVKDKQNASYLKADLLKLEKELSSLGK